MTTIFSELVLQPDLVWWHMIINLTVSWKDLIAVLRSQQSSKLHWMFVSLVFIILLISLQPNKVQWFTITNETECKVGICWQEQCYTQWGYFVMQCWITSFALGQCLTNYFCLRFLVGILEVEQMMVHSLWGRKQSSIMKGSLRLNPSKYFPLFSKPSSTAHSK